MHVEIFHQHVKLQISWIPVEMMWKMAEKMINVSTHAKTGFVWFHLDKRSILIKNHNYKDDYNVNYIFIHVNAQ